MLAARSKSSTATAETANAQMARSLRGETRPASQVDDILYVCLQGAEVYASEPIRGDDFVILDRNREGTVIGLRIIDASQMSVDRWTKFFDPSTGEIPEFLFMIAQERLHAWGPAGGRPTINGRPLWDENKVRLHYDQQGVMYVSRWDDNLGRNGLGVRGVHV